MSKNKIDLKPINNLLGMNFFIPSYQRGYRWTRQQVDDLLNDIWEFSNKKNKTENEFYCLQPVIVRPMNEKETITNDLKSDFDNNKWYEVIDGQQRLTTIKILFSYLIKKHLNGESLKSEYGKNEFIIEYETRKESKLFLDEITTKDTNPNENIDFYHIYEAYISITKWFESKEQQRSVRESVFRTLIKDMETKEFEGIVQVIWYEINDDTNPIDTFIRINMGKIPLTNSELIKALFLQKRNFIGEATELRQIEIANEWDKIEYTLQNDNFWWFLNKDENKISARIEFIFDLMCEVEKKKSEQEGKDKFKDLIKIIGTDEHTTFRLFNFKFSKNNPDESVKEIWNEVKNYFLAFDEWFNEPIWYHYIGFLIYCGTPIIDIYTLYNGTAKDKFLDKIQDKIKEYFKKIECSKKGSKYTINLPFDNRNKQKIRELLLLFNIEYIVKQYRETINSSGEIFIRFPFELFKKESWDIEHIDSFTTNEMKDRKTQIEWIENAKNDLDLDEELKIHLDVFIEDLSKKKSFEELKTDILKIAGEVENSEDVKNSIGNLTLLDAGTNRGYGNALFPTKRRKIIERDTTGKFIPICTKNVFLKYFDKKNPSLKQWIKKDMDNYQSHIGSTIENFLIFKTEESNEQ